MALDLWSREWWGALLDRLRPWRSRDGALMSPAGGFWWGSGDAATYAQLYKTQPHVRTVVDFLASQLGQLGVHVYRRISDTDRVRIADHPLAKLLKQPNDATTRYVFVSELIQDYCVFGNAYGVKLRRPNRLELYRVLPGTMRPLGDLVPRAYAWTLPDNSTVTLPASEVFHLKQYNPEDPVTGLSPLETLRKLLAEQIAATSYREWFWQNGAKLAGWIKRPKEAPRWTPEQREEFRGHWKDFQGPQNAGKTAVLEDGMEFYPITATARDSELIAARKLTREEVAAAFHIPPAMLGILEAQGYGSLREQHRVLYQDTLGPTVAMLEGEIERQLLSEFSDSDDAYVQFNINEKLQGSFEEEVNAMSTAVGSPWMTRNEARARQNLPRINDPAFDQPVTRLDIAEGQNAKNKPAPVEPTPTAMLEQIDAMLAEAKDVRALLPATPTPAPVDLDPLAARIERALRVLPAELAARLPAPVKPTAIIKTRRNEQGHIVAVDEFAADGTLLSHRALVRDAQGRAIELADAVEDAD